VAGRPADPGPVQLLVIAFADGKFDGRVLEELRRLRERDAVRLLDLLFVAKDEDGVIVELEVGDLPDADAAEYGALVRELFGVGTADDGGTAGRPRPAADVVAQNGSLLDLSEVWFLADVIPAAGLAAAVVLLEHRWAIPLRDAVEAADGHDLVDTWVHPLDLSRRD
jgi:hypothetical protein